MARYDSLIGALGHFGAMVASESDEQSHQLLVQATDKSVRCAELIARSLVATASLANLQKTLSQARQQNEDNDQSTTEEEDNQEDEEVTLLQSRPSILGCKTIYLAIQSAVSRFGITVIFPAWTDLGEVDSKQTSQCTIRKGQTSQCIIRKGN
jgi:hypothetical protein